VYSGFGDGAGAVGVGEPDDGASVTDVFSLAANPSAGGTGGGVTGAATIAGALREAALAAKEEGAGADNAAEDGDGEASADTSGF
jgi:hypothetical protein